MNGYRKAREEINISAAELGRRLNVSRMTVYNWEYGKAHPTLENLLKLSEMTGWTMDELVKGSNEDNKSGKLEWLIALREEYGYTQQQIANEVRIRKTDYIKIENGESEPDMQTATKIAALFNTNPDKFFSIG